MSDSLTLRRLRIFLFGLAAALFVGTIVELLLVGHDEDAVQLVPFGLCGLGLLSLAAAWLRPSRWTVRALRIVMALVVIGSLVGVVEHVEGNLELARETQPNATTSRLVTAALTGGTPLLAPGILALTAVLSLAATYSVSPGPSTEPPRSDQTRASAS